MDWVASAAPAGGSGDGNSLGRLATASARFVGDCSIGSSGAGGDNVSVAGSGMDALSAEVRGTSSAIAWVGAATAGSSPRRDSPRVSRGGSRGGGFGGAGSGSAGSCCAVKSRSRGGLGGAAGSTVAGFSASRCGVLPASDLSTSCGSLMTGGGGSLAKGSDMGVAVAASVGTCAGAVEIAALACNCRVASRAAASVRDGGVTRPLAPVRLLAGGTLSGWSQRGQITTVPQRLSGTIN